jgi:hypothetical protein
VTEYTNDDRGALFPRDKRSPKAPDMGGELELSKDTVAYLVNCLKAGKEAKIEISAWRKRSKSDLTFLSCQVQIPFAARKGQNVTQLRPAEPSKEQSYGESIENTPPWDQGGDPLPKMPWE